MSARSWCLRCRRASSACLCAWITTLRPRTKFVVLMHPKEARKTKNGTGRLAHLSLAESELIVGLAFEGHPRVEALLADPALDCRLLYPRKEGLEPGDRALLADSRRLVLFLLDATWWNARKMVRASPALRALPRLSLDVDRPSEFRIKRQPDRRCLSTIEAVDRALLALTETGYESHGAKDSDRLLKPFRRMNEMGLEHAVCRRRDQRQRREA